MPRRAFTLVELLVVITIVVLVSAATLPIVLPALNQRQASEAARILQAALAGARDEAIRANAPRGIRLIPDYQFNGATASAPLTALAASRIIPIEPAPDYSSGLLDMTLDGDYAPRRLTVREVKTIPVPNAPGVTMPSDPVAWFWNVRQGDRIRIGAAGHWYTVAGPMGVGVYRASDGAIVNGERFVNAGAPGGANQSLPGNDKFEYLYLVNGQDDNGNGYVDESFDGIDDDGDASGLTDPGFNGLDDNGDGNVDEPAEVALDTEIEPEAWLGTVLPNQTYTIRRRPVPTQGGREVALPAGVVIDLTSLLPSPATTTTTALPATMERSRLPIDPATHYVDIMIAPNGQVIHAGASSNQAAPMPFYHFWIAERDDVQDRRTPPTGQLNTLPMPSDAPGYASQGDRDLKHESRLVTLFTRTGKIGVVTPKVASPDATLRYDATKAYKPYEAGFDATNLEGVFQDAQKGITEAN